MGHATPRLPRRYEFALCITTISVMCKASPLMYKESLHDYMYHNFKPY